MKKLIYFLPFLALIFVSFFLINEIINHRRSDSPSQPVIPDSAQIIRDSIIKADLAFRNRPWKSGQLVDDFGDRTNERFIKIGVEGMFSNSATAGDYLFAEVLFTKDAVGILLHEYNKTSPPVKFIGSGKIMLKNLNGEILEVPTIREWNKSGGIKIINLSENLSAYSTMLRKFIQKSTGEIKVVINDEYSSVYKFTIDATGFNDAFNLL